MPNSMSMRNKMLYESDRISKKKKKLKLDGKEYDLDEFDERRWWERKRR